MILKVASVVCLALCVLGDGPAISEQKVKINYGEEHIGHHGELSHIGPHEPEHHEEYAWAYPSYEFSYHVNDPHTHDNKGQHESRHGDEVKGEYWLIEPDGRKRTVKYHADKHSGFKAHVEYSAPHHHVHFKTHKYEDHKPVIEEHHEDHGLHHEPIVQHHHVEHKPVLEHHHVEHKPVIVHHYDEHKPVVGYLHTEHHHDDHRPWVIPSHHGHHIESHHRPILRRFQENYHHGHHPRFYRTPKE